MAPTYETASTRQFKHGRTETIRVCCSEGKKMAEAFDDPKVSAAEKVNAVRQFFEAHRRLLVDSSNGQGVDRHLLGLRAMMRDGESHPLFAKDPLFGRSVSFDLSTSNVSPGDQYDGLGFGPATAVGYGINYSLSSDSIRFCVTCKVDPREPQKAAAFRQLLDKTIRDLHTILAKHPQAKI